MKILNKYSVSFICRNLFLLSLVTILNFCFQFIILETNITNAKKNPEITEQINTKEEFKTRFEAYKTRFETALIEYRIISTYETYPKIETLIEEIQEIAKKEEPDGQTELDKFTTKIDDFVHTVSLFKQNDLTSIIPTTSSPNPDEAALAARVQSGDLSMVDLTRFLVRGMDVLVICVYAASLVMIIIAGFKYMLGSVVDDFENAKKILKVAGIAFLLASFNWTALALLRALIGLPVLEIKLSNLNKA